MAKYDNINFTPPVGAANAAKKALKWRKEHGSEVDAGTAVGWTRANQLADRETLSPETVRRMYKFFQRHEKNKAIDPKHKNEPWKDNGYVSWQLWGGDAGKSWAETKWNQMEKTDKKSASEPLRRQPDYGEKGHRPQDYTDAKLIELAEKLIKVAKEVINPYLNTSPTELRRELENEDNPIKRQQIAEALNAWRLTVPGPFRKTKAAKVR